ncbi:MAG TPA: hypothetical protein DC042_15595 [Bacteroidales bacterium]|nr:hypothetical protein [Bacteroidales bacterium]
MVSGFRYRAHGCHPGGYRDLLTNAPMHGIPAFAGMTVLAPDTLYLIPYTLYHSYHKLPLKYTFSPGSHQPIPLNCKS